MSLTTTSEAIARFVNLASPAQSRAFELADDADRPSDAEPIVAALNAASDLRDCLQDLAAENEQLRAALAAATTQAGPQPPIPYDPDTVIASEDGDRVHDLGLKVGDEIDVILHGVTLTHATRREFTVSDGDRDVTLPYGMTGLTVEPLAELKPGTPLIWTNPRTRKDETDWAYSGESSTPGRIDIKGTGPKTGQRITSVDPANVRPAPTQTVLDTAPGVSHRGDQVLLYTPCCCGLQHEKCLTADQALGLAVGLTANATRAKKA